MFSAPIKGRSPCYASLHCKEHGHMRSGTFTTQGKRYIQGSKPYSRAFTTIEKQTTNHAK